MTNTKKKEDSTFIWTRREHHKKIKIRAAEREITMADLLDEIFEFYFKAHPQR